MGGKSSTLSWITAPLRWTPVTANELMDARRVNTSDLFSHEASSASISALSKSLAVGNDMFAARCMGILFGRRAITLPEPDSAGGYNSILSQLLQANNDQLDSVVQNIIDATDGQERASATATVDDESNGGQGVKTEGDKEGGTRKTSKFECLNVELSIPLRNYRILVLHIVRLVEQFCTINTASEADAIASLVMSSSERRELLCGMKLLTYCASYFLEVYDKTPQECLDFASIAPTPDMAINMGARLPSSVAVFLLRRSSLFRQLWDNNEDADSPGYQMLILLAQMTMFLTSLFSSQMSQKISDDSINDTDESNKRFDASFFYEKLRVENSALVPHIVHLLLNGCVTFAQIATEIAVANSGTSSSSSSASSSDNAPQGAFRHSDTSAAVDSETEENSKLAVEESPEDRELSWFPNLFSIRPLSIGEAVTDVGWSLFNIVAFPIKFLYQGAKAAFYTHDIGDLEVIMPTVVADAFRRKDTATGALALTLSDVFAALLVALIHPTASGSNNAFRDALCNLKDSHFPVDQGQQYFSQIDFPSVFDALTNDSASAVHVPLRMLLLYFFLEGNRAFREYVYARTDCETLLLPLLNQLYSYTVCSKEECETDNGQHQYTVLLVTILQILSEDASFAKNIHTVPVSVQWYSETYLPQTTLGGLLVLVLMRLLTSNLRCTRDAFLHMSCVAILSNLAPHFVDLPALPANRLVKFVEIIYKKCFILQNEGESQEMLATFNGFLSTHMRIVLSSLQCGLEHNPNIVYSLLQEQSVFRSLADNPAFAEVAKPLVSIIDFFEKELLMSVTTSAPASGEIGEAPTDVEDVLRIVTVRAPACKATVGLTDTSLEEYKYTEDKRTSWRFFETLSWRAIMWVRAVPFSTSLVSLFPVSVVARSVESSTEPSAATTTTTTTTFDCRADGDDDDCAGTEETRSGALTKGEANV